MEVATREAREASRNHTSGSTTPGEGTDTRTARPDGEDWTRPSLTRPGRSVLAHQEGPSPMGLSPGKEHWIRCPSRGNLQHGCCNGSLIVFDRDPRGGPESRLSYARLFRRRRARAGARTARPDEDDPGPRRVREGTNHTQHAHMCLAVEQAADVTTVALVRPMLMQAHRAS
jgi:hypothetical protein